MKIAIAQVKSSPDKNQNLQTAIELTEAAAATKTELIVFPEFLMAFSPADQSAAELAATAEPLEGPFLGALRAAARSAQVAVLATLYESCPVPQRVYDTAVWIDGRGELAAVYRKLHLYDAFGFRESDKFAPGDDVSQPVTMATGRFGVMICYDLRFPEMARMLALAGANILLAPSGWVQGDLKIDHWQTMIRARALENGCYVIAPDQVGNIYIGHSMIADPLGRTLLDMGEREGMEVIDIDPASTQDVRTRLPLLENRREDIYRKYGRPT